MKLCNLSFTFTRKRVLLWLGLVLLCLSLTVVLLVTALNFVQNDSVQIPHEAGKDRLKLEPGQELRQEFIVRGRTGGLWTHLQLDSAVGRTFVGPVELRIEDPASHKVHYSLELNINQLRSVEKIALPEIFLDSGRTVVLVVSNRSEEGFITLGYNKGITAGKLTVDGEQIPGYLNYMVGRISDYQLSPLFWLVVLVTNVTVLAGAALVLFTDVKIHTLYLVLAVGFGIVMLFDLTPLYGFDMRFQFDSAYVLSNEMLGMEGLIETPSVKDPGKTDLSYYRRYGDDYTHFSHYYDDFVYMNYTDTYRGLRHLRFAEENRELVLVKSYQNGIGEQLYLYLPQALSFTAARLLGLGFYPMLQLARVVTYAVFVLMVYLGIRQIPFGKQLMLIFALIPAVLVETVSINRDAMILAMCFYLMAKILAMAYGAGMPSKLDWLQVMVLSMLLAPCKMVYLPFAFLWLLVIYRKYIREKGLGWKKGLGLCCLFAIPVMLFFVYTNLASIANISQADKASLDGTAAYTVGELITHPMTAVYLLINTIRSSLGSYLSNAIQLFDIRLGSSDGITFLVLFLITLEVFSREPQREVIRPEERGFMILVFLGVFGLLALASMQWTPKSSNTIQGLQGRYLTPVLPLLCVSMFGRGILRTGPKGDLLVKLGCCILPGIVALNMYLWTISGINIIY